MKLDWTFAADIRKQAYGDGTREARFAFMSRVRAARKALSTTRMQMVYGDVMKEFGRVPVAVCTAVTIWDRRDRLSGSTVAWALEVLKLWTNRPCDIMTACIDDGLHPTRIEEYAGEFIRLTTEEEYSEKQAAAIGGPTGRSNVCQT